MNYRKWLFSIILLFPCHAFSAPYYGALLSYSLIGKEPETVRAVQIMLNYDPQCFQWRKFNVYFDGGFSHLWVTDTAYNRVLNIYSIAPVIHYSFRRRGFFQPYLELSIGIAYLTKTRLDNRNLGIHFSFQDRFGIGTFLGPKEQWSLGIHWVHYSNAHLSEHNSGITIPLELDVGYRFQ